MTETQIFWLSAFADELAKLVKNFMDGDDICSKQVLNVLRHIEKYIERYPNPQDAARAMSYTGRINHGRDEAIQRGEECDALASSVSFRCTTPKTENQSQ